MQVNLWALPAGTVIIACLLIGLLSRASALCRLDPKTLINP